MLAKGTAAGHLQSRPVNNTIWPASSVGVTAVPPMGCRVSMLFSLVTFLLLVIFFEIDHFFIVQASMLRSPSCGVGWTPLLLPMEGLGPLAMHSLLFNFATKIIFKIYKVHENACILDVIHLILN